MGNYDLDDVCDRLDSIEAAITKNAPWPDTSTWVGVLIAWALIAGFPDMWHSKLRYSIQYGADYSQVTKEDKPHDCDWMKAPLGAKFCSYDIQVSTVQVKPNRWGGQSISYDEGKTWSQTAKSVEGYPIVSNDDGKTWTTAGEYARSETKPQVNVSWEKIADQ